MKTRWIDENGHFYDWTSVVVRGKRIFNPTETELREAGYHIYVEPEPEPPTLDEYKENVLLALAEYDSSTEVNAFYIGEDMLWIDKPTRTGLMLRISAEEAEGKETTTLWYGTKCYELQIENAKLMLIKIECYASECYDNTAQHGANIKAAQTIEEVIGYDYKTGYPEKLHF